MQPLIGHIERDETGAAQHVNGGRVAGAALQGEHPVDAQLSAAKLRRSGPGNRLRLTWPGLLCNLLKAPPGSAHRSILHPPSELLKQAAPAVR